LVCVFVVVPFLAAGFILLIWGLLNNYNNNNNNNIQYLYYKYLIITIVCRYIVFVCAARFLFAGLGMLFVFHFFLNMHGIQLKIQFKYLKYITILPNVKPCIVNDICRR